MKWGELLEPVPCFHPRPSAKSHVALDEGLKHSGLQLLPLILERPLVSSGRHFTPLADLTPVPDESLPWPRGGAVTGVIQPDRSHFPRGMIGLGGGW